jgi:hypothetical protein
VQSILNQPNNNNFGGGSGNGTMYFGSVTTYVHDSTRSTFFLLKIYEKPWDSTLQTRASSRVSESVRCYVMPSYCLYSFKTVRTD